jgi:rhodanese-related sulfurtransferase
MVPVAPHRLSLDLDVPRALGTPSADPMQRFFNWDVAIGPASISSRLVLVASRQRALDLLEGVQSNGVRLLDHGLVRFVGAIPEDVETHGTLVLVAPSLSTARLLLDRGVRVQAILVDGYERLHRGRHELPFLINRQGAPPIISWSATGYYPATPPTWLPPHKRLEVSSDDLASILELEDASADFGHASLWEAATGIAVRARVIPVPDAEAAIVIAIDTYLQVIRSSQVLPEYWQHYLTTFARTLRTLVASTPAEWSEIKRFASAWSSSIDEKWSSLRPSAIAALADLRDADKHVLKLIGDEPDVINSRATALAAFMSEQTQADSRWYLVCDRPEQAKAAASALRALGLRAVAPVLLRDLAVCSTCVVTGWISSSFARRLWAHTPRAVVALTDENDRQRWERAAEAQHQHGGLSLLSAVGSLQPAPGPANASSVVQEDQQPNDNIDAGWGIDERVPCVFLWVTGESEAKVLEPGGRVVVEESDVVHERVAARLRPDDRVILGLGTSRWSPAEEFTGAVIDAVETSHPDLVKMSREWRRALRQLVETQQLSTSQLQARLAAVGVGREEQTLEGWLDIDRASPIAPRGLRTELAALWPLVKQHAEHSLEEIAAACARLRALRTTSGHALLQLWKGRTVELGVDEAWLYELVDRLRQEVQVYEVEAVTLGEVPRAMLGWWIPPTLAGRFESDSAPTLPPTEANGEDDAGTG